VAAAAAAPGPELVTRARAALLGLVVGAELGTAPEEAAGVGTVGVGPDAQGTVPQGEGNSALRLDGLPPAPAMALHLAESLAEHGELDVPDVTARWVRWMRAGGPGMGSTTRRALELLERGTEPFEAGRLARDADPHRSAGNGALTRCIPVALRYHDHLEKLIRVCAQQAAITHGDERCTWGAAALGLAVRELLQGNRHFVDEVRHRLADRAPRTLLEAIGRVPWEEEGALPIAVAGETGYVVHCVEVAFWCAVHAPSLEAALVLLTTAGGDTVTNAAVAGALLGTRDGETAIPGPWRDRIRDATGVAELAERLVRYDFLTRST